MPADNTALEIAKFKSRPDHFQCAGCIDYFSAYIKCSYVTGTYLHRDSHRKVDMRSSPLWPTPESMQTQVPLAREGS